MFFFDPADLFPSKLEMLLKYINLEVVLVTICDNNQLLFIKANDQNIFNYCDILRARILPSKGSCDIK